MNAPYPLARQTPHLMYRYITPLNLQMFERDFGGSCVFLHYLRTFISKTLQPHRIYQKRIIFWEFRKYKLTNNV